MREDEELISNMSYTASDFRSIYPQLLDTAKVLTNKWDPSLSNESDPGNILIKEAAIVGDKNNYHIDKNILECFPLSATQQASARQLYDIAGYKMHWYNSALANINFSLLKPIASIENELNNNIVDDTLVIPANTQVQDSSGTYIYTTLAPCSINLVNEIKSTSAIQGVITQYKINGESKITIDMLDENLRLYFPYSTIAENGIYVCLDGTSVETVGFKNTDEDDDDLGNFWRLVDNLNGYPLNSKIFMFGVDLMNDNCYIQFPDDISSSNMIENGLNVYYTTTSGANGTINKNILNSFVSDVINSDSQNQSFPINDYVIISNSDSIPGTNQETLESAYKNYKKTIGTYKTLVSRRDYQNAIYELRDNTLGTPVVSNAVITDRTCDPNYSQKVVISTAGDSYTKSFVVQKDGADIINSYDVILYLLKEKTPVSTIKDYAETFDSDINSNTQLKINNAIDDYKSVQHNLKYITEIDTSVNAQDLIFDIENTIELHGTVTTYHTISKKEALDIQTTITQALIQKYNGRQLDFGNPIVYDDVVTTIKDADSRIRTVSLSLPEYLPTMKKANGTPINLYDSTSDVNYNIPTLAKMILSGNVQLFVFQDDFEEDFGQTASGPIENIESLTTSNPIVIKANNVVDITNNPPSVTTSTTLDENDIIQLLKESLIASASFTAGVWVLTNTTLAQGVETKLGANDKVKFQYVDNGVPRIKTVENGTILRANNITINPPTIQEEEIPTSWWSDFGNHGTYLSATQSVEILEKAQYTLDIGTRYYVISHTISDSQYQLTVDSSGYILDEGEYLLYLSADNTGMVVLGSGNTIKSSTSINLTSPYDDLSDVLDTSIETIQSKWNRLTSELQIVENEILTLTSGDKIAVNAATNNDITCKANSQFDDTDKSFSYQLKEEQEAQLFSTISGYIYYRGTFQINAGPDIPQTLINTQKITFTKNGGSQQSISGKTFQLSYPLNRIGGKDVDIRVLNEQTGEYEAKVKCYYYTKSNLTDGLTEEKTERTSDLLVIKNTEVRVPNNGVNLNFTFKTGSDDYDMYFLPVTTLIRGDGEITLTVTNGGTIAKFNSESTGTSVTIEGGDETKTNMLSEIYVIKCTNGCQLNIKFVPMSDPNPASLGDYDSITLKHFKHSKDLNSDEINCNVVANGKYYTFNIKGSYIDQTTDSSVSIYSTLVSKIKNLPGSNSFDWTFVPSAEDKVLSPLVAESYFNPNHVYNSITIPKIDFNNSSIVVSSSNIK